MHLESMKRDFVNLQDRCRAVIVKKIKRKQDIEKLFLPTKIKMYLAEAIEERIEPLKPVNITNNNLGAI